MRRNRRRRLTPYQRVKRTAGNIMLICGAVSFGLTLASLYWSNVSVTLFFIGTSLGFWLVGFQQYIDAIAAGADTTTRR